MAFDNYRNVVRTMYKCFVAADHHLAGCTSSSRVDWTRFQRSATNGSCVTSGKSLFTKFRSGPMMSRMCSDSDGPRTPKKCGFYCIEILLYAALALIAYNSQLLKRTLWDKHLHNLFRPVWPLISTEMWFAVCRNVFLHPSTILLDAARRA